MNIGLVSYESVNNDLGFNLSQIEKALRAVSDRADLLCFGEAFLQGFDSLTWNFDMDKKTAISQDSNTMEALKKMTLEYGTDLLLGYLELDGDAIYSSCALIEKGEITYNYRRTSQGWKEISLADGHYREGTSAEEFTYQDQTFKIALCGDLWDHPERFRTEGTLIWPVYVNYTTEDWKKEEEEYAKQAGMVCDLVLMVNPISHDPESHGGAFIFSEGKLFNDVIYDTENILIIGI